MKLGLAFFMDYNEDRQVSMDEFVATTSKKSVGEKVDGVHDKDNAFIYLNTIGDRFYLFSETI